MILSQSKLFLFPILFILSIASLKSQYTIQIIGETELCVGGCFEYYLSVDTIEQSEWQVIGPNGFSWTGDPDRPQAILICFDIPGVYTIQAWGYTNFGEQYYAELTVIVFDFFPAEIFSNAIQFCPLENPGSNCEKVCEGTTVDYFIEDQIGGGNVLWQVSGAESYEQDGNGGLSVTWGEAGFGIVSALLSPDIPGCEKSSTICVEIIEIPEANFETTPPADNGVVTICRGQSVYIENQSSGAIHYDWQSSNGQGSSDPNPVFDFPTEGNYTISLVAKNECGCADSTSITIEVLPGESPFVDCVGTICENEISEYTTTADCSQFNWSTSPNGNILDGGGLSDDFIIVEWGVGPEGWIYLETSNCNGNYCNEAAMIRIPIVSDNAEITGNEIVCKGAIENYEVADYNATSYFWTVSPGNMIIEGQGTNEISIQWRRNVNIPSSEWIVVEYNNCYLECTGRDTLEVIIGDEFFIEGPFEVCPSETSSFQTRRVSNINQGLSANWEIYGPNGMLYWNSTMADDEINILWPDIQGIYSIRAVPEDPSLYCTDNYQINVQVNNREDVPDDILGEFDICQGNPYKYVALSLKPNNLFTWYVNDGSDEYQTQGNPIVVQWNSAGPYELSVSQTDYNNYPCESERLLTSLESIQTIQINGNDQSCLEDVEIYQLDPLDYVDIQWEVVPQNAGTIISGQGTDLVEIQWNSLGDHQLKVNSCALEDTYNITVNGLPTPAVNHPTALCEGDLATVSTSLSYSSYQWFDESGALVSSAAQPDLTSGFYQVEVTDNLGCRGLESFYIENYISPEINISTPDFVVFCIGPPWPTLFALESDPPYSYQWFKNGNPVGGNTSIFNSDGFGSYYVEIEDMNGCQNTSNVLNIVQNCGGGGGSNPGCVSASGNIDFTFNNAGDCNVFNFQNASSNYLAGSLQYFFGDPIMGTSFQENPQFAFPGAGYQKVLLLGQVPDDANPGAFCSSGMIKIVEVPIAADFDFEVACEGEISSFENRSTFIPGETINSWQWDFGDPGSGADNNSNLENPNHVFSSSGAFDITLIISNGNCTARKVISVYVPSKSSISFDDPIVSCELEAIPFEGLSPEFISSWQWDFGDPSSGDANVSNNAEPYHEYASAGNYTVTLEGTNIYGCTSTFSKLVVIESNNLTGNLAYSTPICDGEVTQISSPPGGTSWLWSTGETTETISTSEAGIYTVTITDSEGCTYNPPPAVLEVLPNPITSIRAIKFDEYGQVISTHYEMHATCFGENVTIEAIDNDGYDFVWSTGILGHKLEFLKERGTLLDPGVYEFYVELTDKNTLCDEEFGPFTLTVHPNPLDVVISSNPGGYLCSGDMSTLTVQNPEAGVDYYWSNGAEGQSLVVGQEGSYYAVGINAFGCMTQSNEIIIHKAPDIGKIPTGCLVRCNPDTICLPSIANVASFQWYLDGTAIPGPGGQAEEFIATETGNYHVELTDVFGCTATSEGFDLELTNGFGSIFGKVYFDVNDNGVIDAPDTLMEGISFTSVDINGNSFGDISGQDGAFFFFDILSTEYSVVLDTLTLPPSTKPYDFEFDVELIGCDDSLEVAFLVHEFCEPLGSSTELKLCHNEIRNYYGINLSKDTSFQILHTASTGCDSIEMVEAKVLEELKFEINSDPTCSAENNGAIDVEILSGGLDPFEFSLNGIDFQTGQYFEQLTEGDYLVYVKDSNGCIYNSDINIEMIQPLEFEIPDQIIACHQDNIWSTFELMSGDTFNILWSDGSSADVINIFQPGNYWVELSNKCELIKEEFVVSYEQVNDETLMYIPNIFSPNEDGINDDLEIFVKNEFGTQVILFQIYDRWGNILFESTDLSEKWNGKFQNKNMNPGVYTWHARIAIDACHEEKEIFKYGDVTLIR